MERVATGDRDPDSTREGVAVHALSDPLGTTDVAVNRYRVGPGKGLPAGLHAHRDQEEVFVVLAGVATFEVILPATDEPGESSTGSDGETDGSDDGTDGPGEGDDGTGGRNGRPMDESDAAALPGELSRGPDGRATGELTVRAGEAVRFAPGEFQSGRNGGDGELVVLALGAPRDGGEVALPVECPACRRGDLSLETGPGGVTFVCPDCGTERVPRDCPACGNPDLRVTLGDGGGTVATCPDCGAEYETPPVENPS